MLQGAGESDVLQAQMMSLRNWQFNQTEANRSYYDTLRSLNSSLTDLNVDTKTALANNELQANADREAIWTNYHDRRSEAFTQLGNIRGQQADYYAEAEQMVKGSTKLPAPKKQQPKKQQPKQGETKAGKAGKVGGGVTKVQLAEW